MAISAMISASSSSLQPSGMTEGKPSANRPTQLPATGNSSTEVSISPEAKKLAAARAITSNPVAVAAASNNSQVDKLATSVYMAQQNQRLIDTYSANSGSGSSSSSTGSGANAVAIAAVSDNPQVDQLATTVYSAQQAQKMVDQYQSSSEQAKQSNSLNTVA